MRTGIMNESELALSYHRFFFFFIRGLMNFLGRKCRHQGLVMDCGYYFLLK